MNRKTRDQQAEAAVDRMIDAELSASMAVAAPADADAFPSSDEPARLTRAVEFRSLGPHFDSPCLLRVNAGAETHAALSLAECLLSGIRTRLADAAHERALVGDEAFAHEFLIDVVRGLYAASGARS